MKRRLAVGGGLAVLGVLALSRALGLEYALSQWVFVATYAIAGLGVCVVVGQSGQVSLGQGAMLGLGAYTQALLVLHGVPAGMALLAAVAVGALGGALASLPAQRLGGLYFAMSTLAFALIVEEVLVRWEGVTHGAAGLAVPALRLGSWPVDAPWAQAVLSAALLVLALLCCRCWVRSGAGRAWRAVREDELAASACGIDTARVKRQAFVVGGGLAGLAGGLYAHWIGYLSPEQFGLLLSFELLMLAFIGGARRLRGAVWGAAVLVAIPQVIAVTRDALPAEIGNPAGLEAALFGAVIVAVVLLRPQGIAGDDSRQVE